MILKREEFKKKNAKNLKIFLLDLSLGILVRTSATRSLHPSPLRSGEELLLVKVLPLQHWWEFWPLPWSVLIHGDINARHMILKNCIDKEIRQDWIIRQIWWSCLVFPGIILMDKKGSGTPTVIEIDGENLHKYEAGSRRVNQGWFPFQISAAQKHKNQIIQVGFWELSRYSWSWWS